MYRRSVSKSILILTSALYLASCGGGGSSAPTTVVTPPPPPPTGSAPTTPSLRFSDQAASRGLSLKTEFSVSLNGMPRHFAGGAAGGDIDADGDIDLVILRGDLEANLLLLNDGTGNFTDATPTALALPKDGTANYKLSGPTLADVNGDGHLDLFIGGLDGDPSLIFQGDGEGDFTDVSAGSGLEAMTSVNTISAAFGDYDGDGDPDLLLAHWGTPRDASAPGETETLYRNDSTLTDIRFTPVSAASGLIPKLDSNAGVLGPNHDYSFAPNFVDLDNDGDLDVFMVADFFTSQVYRNKGDGTFTNITDPNQITDTNGMGAAVGDVNGDGALDVFASSINGNRLYMNSSGTLINDSLDAGIEVGGWGWGSCMADFDLDGDLDIYQTNGWINDGGAPPQSPYTSDPTRLWLNEGDGTFTDGAEETSIQDTAQGRGIVCADFDNDRDIDVLLMLSDTDPGAMLWVNTLNSSDGVWATAKGPTTNTQGLGARITLNADGQVQMRELRIGSNFTSHNPVGALFGLNGRTPTSLRIDWPDGKTETRSGISAGDAVTFNYDDAI